MQTKVVTILQHELNGKPQGCWLTVRVEQEIYKNNKKMQHIANINIKLYNKDNVVQICYFRCACDYVQMFLLGTGVSLTVSVGFLKYNYE